MNRIIESDWSELPRGGKGQTQLFEAYAMGKPKWWKMVDQDGDMAFVEFSFLENITVNQFQKAENLSINDTRFNLLWIDSLWVPHDRRGHGFGFMLLDLIQCHFKFQGSPFYCGLTVSPFENNIRLDRLKAGYLKQGFIEQPKQRNMLLRY